MTRPEFILTRHARERMAQRQISPEEVGQVVRDPETRYANERRGSETLTGHPGGRLVKVIIVIRSEPPLVITVED